jgi:protoporphyrin/coproporphyrin ferrochelatase
MSERTAVLLLAHGTPDTLEEIPEYLRNVTGGRSLPESVIEEIRHRYSLIGASPLTSLTLEQGRLLSQELCLPVYVGMRNWKPYIGDVLAKMREDGVERAVAICLAPQNSRTSVGLYRRAVFAAADGLEIDFIEAWAEHPLLADAFAERLRTVWHPFSAEANAPVPVLFTAHSVPCRTILAPTTSDSGTSGANGTGPDPYPIEARRTAALVAERVQGLTPDNWFFAFQSQGMSGGPWIGPTVEDTLTALRRQGMRNIVIQPVGFLCDHVEILYDIDIGFRQFAANLEMELRRPESLNGSPLLIAALADLARAGLARLKLTRRESQ